MNAKYIRFFALCSALLILVTVLTACAPAHPKETISPTTTQSVSIQEEKELLLDSWKTYLKAIDGIYHHVSWALDYVDAFSADNSWDSLLKARAACIAAKQYLDSYPVPEFTLTDEQCKALNDAGIETETVQSEYLGFEQTLHSEVSTLNSLDLILHDDVFYSAIATNLASWIEAQRDCIADYADYLCLCTNYLLVQLEMPEVWEQFPVEFPLMAKVQRSWNADLDALLKETSLVLDHYEGLFVQMSAFLGRSDYILELTREALDTGDLQYLAAEVHTVDGIPFYLPIPDWLLDDVTYRYLVTNPETQEKESVQSGQEISQTPSGCYVSCKGIRVEEVQQYAQQLIWWEYSPYEGWVEQDKKYEVFLTVGDSALLVQWTPEKTVFYMSDSVGCLATQLYLLAKFSVIE